MGVGFSLKLLRIVRNIVSFFITNEPLEEALQVNNGELQEVVVKGFRTEDNL